MGVVSTDAIADVAPPIASVGAVGGAIGAIGNIGTWKDARILAASAVKATDGYIVSALFDNVFFILSPVLGVLLMALYSLLFPFFPNALGPHHIGTHYEHPATFFVGVLTMAHLFLVFFRSHANPKIFRLYPGRFVLAPAMMLVAMWSSLWVTVLMAILGVWWDVYHSSLQTFGLGRIYDSRKGNDSQRGRRLDYFLNLFLYAGPILSGASFMAHIESFQKAANPGLPAPVYALSGLTAWAQQNASNIQHWIIPVGCAYVVFYIASYARMARDGYTVSPQKVALLASTAVTSVTVWGLNPAGTAFLIMNFFHAFQYFGLVWTIENGNIQRVFGLAGRKQAKPLALALFVVVPAAYGVWSWLVPNTLSTIGSFTMGRLAVASVLTVSICHFWWDGFIWSVRKRQV
ncbi:MAG TPA: hypothetical protein VGK20_09540 [Candidatus Binatia bacterium]|jgi:hypothetical protein